MLQGKSVRLRPVEMSDLDLFVELKADFSSLEMLATKLSPISPDAVSIWLKKSSESFEPMKFTIIDKDSSEKVGYIGFENIDFVEGHSGFGFFVRSSCRGKGYGSEALRLILEYGFFHLRLRRIYTEVLETNIASQRVVKNLGFIEEGRLRQQAYRNGNYIDVLVFGIINDEFKRIDGLGEDS